MTKEIDKDLVEPLSVELIKENLWTGAYAIDFVGYDQIKGPERSPDKDIEFLLNRISFLRHQIQEERSLSDRLEERLNDLLHHGMVYENGEIHTAGPEKAKETLEAVRKAREGG